MKSPVEIARDHPRELCKTMHFTHQHDQSQELYENTKENEHVNMKRNEITNICNKHLFLYNLKLFIHFC